MVAPTGGARGWSKYWRAINRREIQETGTMQHSIYDNAVKAMRHARAAGNRGAARKALERAKLALALIHLGYE
jgi:hypothetical protein